MSHYVCLCDSLGGDDWPGESLHSRRKERRKRKVSEFGKRKEKNGAERSRESLMMGPSDEEKGKGEKVT